MAQARSRNSFKRFVVEQDGIVLRPRQFVVVTGHFEVHDEFGRACGRSCRDRTTARRVLVGFRRHVADGAEHRAVGIADAAHRAHVDQLHVVAFEHEIVGLEVAIDEVLAVQIGEGRQDAEDIGDRLGDRQRAALLADRVDRLAADILHHDEAFGALMGEIEDLDDLGMLDGGEELPLRHRRGGGFFVLAVEQTLEHHPAIEQFVEAEIDPAEAAIGDGSFDAILAGDDVARLEAGMKLYSAPQCVQKPLS